MTPRTTYPTRAARLHPRVGDDLLGLTLDASRGGFDRGRTPAPAPRGRGGLVAHRGTNTRSAPGTASTVTGVRPARSLSATTAALGLCDGERMELKAGALVVRMPVADGSATSRPTMSERETPTLTLSLRNGSVGTAVADWQPRAGRLRVREHQRAGATAGGKCAARRERERLRRDHGAELFERASRTPRPWSFHEHDGFAEEADRGRFKEIPAIDAAEGHRPGDVRLDHGDRPVRGRLELPARGRNC